MKKNMHITKFLIVRIFRTKGYLEKRLSSQHNCPIFCSHKTIQMFTDLYFCCCCCVPDSRRTFPLTVIKDSDQAVLLSHQIVRTARNYSHNSYVCWEGETTWRLVSSVVYCPYSMIVAWLFTFHSRYFSGAMQ